MKLFLLQVELMSERSGEHFHSFLCSGMRAVMMLRRNLEDYEPCALGEGLTSCQCLL